MSSETPDVYVVENDRGSVIFVADSMESVDTLLGRMGYELLDGSDGFPPLYEKAEWRGERHIVIVRREGVRHV